MKTYYRPEIDGLRAIAVVAVLLYHARITVTIFDLKPFTPFLGGFIGVDIFFVISGYLISSIIFRELELTGSFSFKHFYERRIRRLLPVLLVVMLVSLPFAWIYMFPSGFIDLSKSILYSLGFSSNFYFYFTGETYFDPGVIYKPFLHTWSLSVEEQYYILFPITLIVIFKYYRKYLIFFLFLTFLISLGLDIWTSKSSKSIAFYFLHTRIWELIAGSILAYFEINFGRRAKNKILILILPAFGLFFITHSILFLDNGILHPSLNKVSVIIGVCLIIWFSHKDEFITKILSSKMFVGVGLISYSLYIWHYPIFAFLKINGMVSGSFVGKLLVIPGIFILSVLSYSFIELPFRNKKFNFKKILIFLGFLLLILIFFNLKAIQLNGFKDRFDNLKSINENYNPDNSYLFNTRMEESNTSLKNFNDDEFNVLIFGISHGQDFFNALNLNRDLFEGIKFFYGGNIFTEDLIKNQKYIKKSNMVILSYRWDDHGLSLLKNNLEKIKNLNDNIAITSRSNEYRVASKLYTLLDQKVLFDKKKFNYFGLKKLYFENRIINSESDINQRIKNFAIKNKLKYLNKEDYMCEVLKNECDYVDHDGYKIFLDHDHYTKQGAKFFGKKIYETNWLKLD